MPISSSAKHAFLEDMMFSWNHPGLPGVITYGSLATRLLPLFGRSSRRLSTVGFLGQIVTFVGAGEGRSGVGTLASPMGAGATRQGNRTPGDPRVPTLPPCHPRPYGTKPSVRDEAASLFVSQNSYP